VPISSTSASSAGTAPWSSPAKAARSSPSRSRLAPPGRSTWGSESALAGPLFLAGDGRRLDRHGAARIVRRVTRRAGIAKHVSPRTLRHAFITAALDAGVPLRDVQEAASRADPRTTMRYDRARTSLDRHATYIVAAYVAGAAR
jgi:integrase